MWSDRLLQDYYEELGVGKTADKSEIKSGKRRFAALFAGAVYGWLNTLGKLHPAPRQRKLLFCDSGGRLGHDLAMVGILLATC